MVGRATGTGQMLHQALADYIEMLRGQERPGDSGWARTQANQAERLKKAHKDECLSNIGLTEMQRMFDYWRFRPKAETTNRPISPNTAGNHIWQLTDFFNWLHKEPKYEWRRPADCWIDIDKAIKLTTADKADRHQTLQVPTYSPEELAILYGYASPLMRAMILLALNCGFKQAELGTLRVSETFLNQAHPYAKMLGIPVNPNDSFIKRVRIKSGVYGEWLLWPETVQAIHWALDRRSQVKTNTPYLLVSSKGRGYADKTSAGNKPSMVRNYWESLLDTIQTEPNHEAFRRLAFSQLRETGSDMVRAASDGEIAAVYECHGQPVRSDSLADIYTNRPFGKVFDALRKVRDRLEPMFADVPKVQIHQPTGT
jgi:integrase